MLTSHILEMHISAWSWSVIKGVKGTLLQHILIKGQPLKHILQMFLNWQMMNKLLQYLTHSILYLIFTGLIVAYLLTTQGHRDYSWTSWILKDTVNVKVVWTYLHLLLCRSGLRQRRLERGWGRLLQLRLWDGADPGERLLADEVDVLLLKRVHYSSYRIWIWFRSHFDGKFVDN